MRHVSTILILLVCWVGGFAQDAPQPESYADLIKTHRENAKQLQEASQALIQAKAAYKQVIQSLAATKSYDGSAQEQIDWMVAHVPNLLSAIAAPEEQAAETERWVNAFAEAFGLSKKQKRSVRRGLRSYLQAFSQYSSAYYQMGGVAYSGAAPPPTPPPPPPPQQHH
jgi:type IV secretory pathway TraG/TraD family ATPase VirD4